MANLVGGGAGIWGWPIRVRDIAVSIFFCHFDHRSHEQFTGIVKEKLIFTAWQCMTRFHNSYTIATKISIFERITKQGLHVAIGKGCPPEKFTSRVE